MIIAIDGPAASGKGTLARKLARHYDVRHLDTGSLYRAVARDLLDRNEDIRSPSAGALRASQIDAGSLEDKRLRDPGIGEAASIVASIPEVREALLLYQRRFAETPPGAVLDGRDIGTTVCPGADIKLFVTASAEERAQRRFLEHKGVDPQVTKEQVLEDIKRRDARDASRAISPLVPAADAHLLDTTNLDIETAYNVAVELIDAVLKQKGCTS